MDATRSLPSEYGQDLTLARIAKQLGVSKQAVLYQYSTKEAVLIELGVRAYEHESAHVVAAWVRGVTP